LLQIGFLEILIILLVGIVLIGPDQLPSFIKFSMKSLTRFQNKLFEFRSSIERDIGAEDLKQDIYNELKMEEFQKDEDERSK
jgi:sec-independent protein translocase protein TatB|tara:strand:+ start:542 stop:787 length:246 start_codon:yes stop_codon:yes gene_type:complete